MDKNTNIQCVVSECRYHSGSSDYCTLQQIQVGKNDSFTSKAQDTNCSSFEVKDKQY